MLRRATFRTITGVLVSVLTALMMFSLPGQAGASLLGDTVSCSSTNVGLGSCTPTTAEVKDPDVEFTIFPIPGIGTVFFGINVSASSIQFALTTNFPDVVFPEASITISDLDFDPGADITAVGVVNSGVEGAFVVSFTADSVTLTLFEQVSCCIVNGSVWTNGDSITVNLTTASAAVSEPGTLTLVASALLGVGAVVLRQRRR